MMKYRIILIICVCLLVACEQTGLPPTTTTELPTPTIPATETAVETTTTAAPTETALLPATETTAGSPTPTQTAVPAPSETPTMMPDAELVLAAVAAGQQWTAGETVTINGRVWPLPAAGLTIRFVAAGEETIHQETVAEISDQGEWQVTTTLPPQIAGPVVLVAETTGPDQQAQIPGEIVPPADAAATTIQLTRPTQGGTAVAGYTLFFEGRVQNPIDEMVTIAILGDDCRATAASQSFTVSGGSWFGFTIVSSEAPLGAGCAVAYTGERGSEDGREFRLPFEIIDQTDDRAARLELGNYTDIELKAGRATYLFGVAINAPNDEVNIRLESDDPAVATHLITSATAFVNEYGFWEIDLELPEDAEGFALLTMYTGSNDDNYREIRLPLFIEAE